MNRRIAFWSAVLALGIFLSAAKPVLAAEPAPACPPCVCQCLGQPTNQTAELPIQSYFTPLADQALPKPLQAVAAKWRGLARQFNYTGPVAWRVRAGFTLKKHAPQAGPCYQNFSYLQDRLLRNDEPTKEAIVFWIPRLVPESTDKDAPEQLALLEKLRQTANLPAHHLRSFGSAALLSGLILAHLRETGEWVPKDYLWVRTDTLVSDGRRLDLGRFGGPGLHCGFWGFDGGRYGALGVFALGVDPIRSPE